MKVAVLFGPMCLAFRGSFDFTTLRTDPRGLTGSELGFVRICEELKALGHEVHIFTESAQRKWLGMPVRRLDERDKAEHYDVQLAINEPNLLIGANPEALRVCEFWLNDVTFCPPGFERHVDLFVSPSEPHRRKALEDPSWRVVGVSHRHPKGQGSYEPDPSAWVVNPLGCDPERYRCPAESWSHYTLRCDACGVTKEELECSGRHVVSKIPGRVVYCSSPDRGLHWLLQEWPHIKRAVPHATLKIFYRLRAWIDGFTGQSYAPQIARLWRRALYIDEALKRMSGPEWGIEVCDSVSRERIEREMAQAEVLAYPCDTVSWSEGFSCSTLEACAAGAIPVIWDTDALGEIYRGSGALIKERGFPSEWRDTVIEALKAGEEWKIERHRILSRFAEQHTWKAHTKRLMSEIQNRLREKRELSKIRLVAE